MSTRLDSCYLLVEDIKSRVVGEIEPLGGCWHNLKFEDGESIDMELWHPNDRSTTLVYKNNNEDAGYSGASYDQTFLDKEVDFYY